jgi:hypothetical protein
VERPEPVVTRPAGTAHHAELGAWAALALALALMLAGVALAGCGADQPPPLTRITGWSPQGADAPLDGPASLTLSAAAAPDGLADGTRVALARAADARAVAAAVERDGGLLPSDPALPCDVALADGGRRIELAPRAPLAAGGAYVLVLGPIRDQAGHPVLDPEGRRRTFLGPFQTAPPPPGPPPVPVLTEVRAVAEAPESGGEYVEVADLGEGPLDLDGWRLEKRTAAGGFTGCLLSLAEGGPAPPGGVALLTGAAWDRRYDVPAGAPRYACAASTLAGGLADDRPPDVRLVDPGGTVQATFGAGGAPRCPAAVERLDPTGLDEPANLACTEGTPGW